MEIIVPAVDADDYIKRIGLDLNYLACNLIGDNRLFDHPRYPQAICHPASRYSNFIPPFAYPANVPHVGRVRPGLCP